MDDQQSNAKLSNLKKGTAPVESTINQRPRRKIKHKFIKCNRDSPEKSFTIESLSEVEGNAEDAHSKDPDYSDASTSQASIPKTKNQQKFSSKKVGRPSGRQNRSKDSVPDVDDSMLQMVEIIDDPSDDPNVSIEEIIETCVLDEEEYQRMITCSKDVCNDSSSNTTTTSVTDQSEESLNSSKNKTLCIQNSCERQISVGLVDCMKNKNILKHFNFDERSANDDNNSFEEVFEKSLDEVTEKLDIKPTTEFFTPIRTRRVTRLSSMSAGRRPADRNVSSPMHLSPKIKIGEIEPLETSTTPQLQDHAEIEISENSIASEDATMIESCSSESRCEIETEQLVSTAEPQTIIEESSEASSENTMEELVSSAEVHKGSVDISADVDVEPFESIELSADETIVEQSKITDIETENPPIRENNSETASEDNVDPSQPQEYECNDQLTTDEKTKEKTKLKKEKKRTSDKHNDRHENQSFAEETPQQTDFVSENQLTEQNKSDFIDSVEKKLEDSDPPKQITVESEGDAPKIICSGDSVKTEKTKKKRDSHSDKDNKMRRKSESSKKSEKSFDSQSTSKSSSCKLSSSSSSSTDKRSKDSKESKSGESKKSHKRNSSGVRTEKDIIMDQLRLLEQKAANRNNKSTSHIQTNKEASEKPRDPAVKSKIKSTPDATKLKPKPKEIPANEPKDDKSSSLKSASDQGSLNRKQSSVTAANRLGGMSSRCGTDFILSECYLPKQVKYDESLYSIEALKAAQAAQEEQIKADAEAAKKAREILAAKEEQAKAARAAARLAKQEEAKALEKAKMEAEKLAKAEAEKAEKAIKLAKAATKAARAKQVKDNSNKSTGNNEHFLL